MKCKEMEKCSGCPMLDVDYWYEEDRQKVHFIGKENNFVPPKIVEGDRLAIGEAPGRTESQLGEPFVGGAGEVLNGLLAKAGVSRSKLSIVNTIQCRPPGNTFPDSSDARAYIAKSDADKAIKQCICNYVEPVIRSRAWKRIDILGDKALRLVAGREGIGKWRGSIIDIPQLPGQEIVVPTIHPAALMREQTIYPVVVSDLKKSLVQPPEFYNLYPSVSDLEAFVASTTEFTFDIECNPWRHDEIYMVGLAAKPFYVLCVPFKGPYLKLLKELFAKATAVIGQNIIQFDLDKLENNGVILNRDAVIWDTMLCHHLISPDLPHDLEFIATIYTNKPIWKHKVDENKELYCCRDTDTTAQIFPQLKALLTQLDLLDVYHLVSVPLGKICLLMKQTGVRRDQSRISLVREKLLEQSRLLEAKLPEALRTQQVPCRRRIPAPPGAMGKAGRPIRFLLVDSSETLVPWRSPKIVGDWLYKELGLEEQQHIKTKKRTTDKNSLDRLARVSGNSAIAALRKLRQIDETLTTFAKEATSSSTPTIHTNFNVHGTNSGRLSSSKPNLQNIPEAVRVTYVPHHSGWSIISADYSSIENRVTAWLAQDYDRLKRMADPDFNEHKWTANQWFHIPLDQIEKSTDPDSPYSKAKHINHGRNFGLGKRKTSLMYGVPEKEVGQLFEKWEKLFWKTAKWQEATAAEAKKSGVLTNGFGRKRWFYTSSLYAESLSFLPQSTAADIILRAMVGLLYERVGWPLEKVLKVVDIAVPLPKPANLLLQVHDALIFETPPSMIDSVVSTIRLVMEQSWRALGGFSCPVAISTGPSWGELEDYKL